MTRCQDGQLLAVEAVPTSSLGWDSVVGPRPPHQAKPLGVNDALSEPEQEVATAWGCRLQNGKAPRGLWRLSWMSHADRNSERQRRTKQRTL